MEALEEKGNIETETTELAIFPKITSIMKKLIFTLILSLSFITLASAQVQVIKGTVIDKQSEIPLIGATIELLGEEVQGTTTDIDGAFRLENVAIGRRTIRVSYVGYDPVTIPNIVVTAGKQAVLNIGLEEAIEQLDEVVVRASQSVGKDKAQNEMATISARTFSMEEVNRFSGGRSDVARLAGNFAGVSTADDSRNDIVIRGNSPTGVLWRLEGIPIPNPNHFSTLGTTGGPVSALNPNLLRNSDFLTSAFPAEYGNALAGVFDLNFRSGNKDKHEFMAQVGAVSGIELMAEGPLNKNHRGSFLVAGRYSFVSIASDLGLPIGTNASPNYQDIGFKVDFGSSAAGKFTLFGMAGRSDIEFLGDELEEDDLFAAEDEDAFAKSLFGVVGLKHNYLINDNTYARTIIAASVSGNEYNEDRYYNLNQPDEYKLRIIDVDNTVNRYSINSYINKKFNARLTARAGVLIENYQYNIETNDREDRPDLDDDGRPDWVTIFDFNDGSTMLQAYAQSQYKLGREWVLNTGLHLQYLTLNSTFAAEPRATINWNFTPAQSISLGYGMHHQEQPLPVLLLEEPLGNGQFIQSNKDLGFTRSHHFVLGYDWKFAKDWRAKLETYYQRIENVPVEPQPTSFSLLNAGADFVFPDDRYGLVNEGTGYNTGIELTIEKFFSQGFYSLITASVFDSKYEGSDGVERSTAFNNQYVLNLLGGKEFKIGKDKRNAFTLDTKVTFAGGRPYTPVNLEASREAGMEVLLEDQAFSERFDPYFRWDLKMGIQINSKKANVSHQFYLDVQNVTNNDNIFARRYNRVTNEVNEVNQIGFFPDFMYRIQF